MRYLYHSPQIKPTIYINRAQGAALVRQFRNEIRATLDPDKTGYTWLVTDVSEWSGGQSDGAGFVIEHRDGAGSPTGHEWFLSWPISDSNKDWYFRMKEFLTNSPGDYYRKEDNANTSSGDDRTVVAMHYNHDGGADGYDHFRTDDGTNDGATPASSPYNSFGTFMPAHTVVRGFNTSRNANDFTRDDRYNFVLLFDDAKPFVQLVMCNPYRRVSNIWLSGSIVTPYDTGVDTSTVATCHCALYQGRQSGDSMNVDAVRVDAFDDTGTRQSMDAHWSGMMTRTNSPRSDGAYPWRPVSVSNGSYFKGHLDTDLVREMGVDNFETMAVYGDPPMIHWHRSMVFPWISGEPPFPPGRRFDDYPHRNQGL